MGNLNVGQSNCLTANIPEPPKAIEGIVNEYQNFWESIYSRAYENCNNNPLGTTPIYMPKLSKEEREQIEKLTRRLHSSPAWKDYTQQCKRWAVLM